MHAGGLCTGGLRTGVARAGGLHAGVVRRGSEAYFEILYLLYVVDSLRTLKVIICHLNFKRTENHNITIATNTSQHVEFFHSLICFSYNYNSKAFWQKKVLPEQRI